MAITGNTDYIPTLDLFLAHWGTADGAVLGTLSFEGEAWALADGLELRGELDEATSEVQSRLNDLEMSRVGLGLLREEAAGRVMDFNRRVRAEFGGNPRFAKLPVVPNRNAGRAVFLDAMDDLLDLWNRVDAQPASAVFSPPMLLMDGLTRAQFTLLRREVDAAFTTRAAAENAISRARVERNLLQTEAYGLMKQYRLSVEARFAEGSPELLTLPRLTPGEGHTPEPVVLAAEWSATEGKARLEWTASEEETLQDYQVRGTPGEVYDAEDESVIATVPAGAARVLLSGAGLGLPGAAMSYKVYVRLTTGHTRGSEAVTVYRG